VVPVGIGESVNFGYIKASHGATLSPIFLNNDGLARVAKDYSDVALLFFLPSLILMSLFRSHRTDFLVLPGTFV
jgi:hypothetical protein